VIPVIREATGTISKSFKRYLSNIPSWHDIKALQTTAILALHTYCGKYQCESTKHSTWEITLYVP
jgi:hypothetical protein